MSDLEPGDVVVGRVTVLRILRTDGGMDDVVNCDDGRDEELDMPTAVGMLAVAQHTLLCEACE